MLRSGGRLEGELRETVGRYFVGNCQNSALMTLSSTASSGVTATFDYDSWGVPLSGDPSLASGSDAEKRQNIYGYTGMREANAGGTTYHHARDYRADLRSWLQTDQYMDPMADVGLSMDPTTRDRSAYAGGNPVGNIDTDGHRFTDGDGHESLPTAHGIYHMESNSSTYSCHCSYVRGTGGGYSIGGKSYSSFTGAAKIWGARITAQGGAVMNTREVKAGWAFDDAVQSQRIGTTDWLYNAKSGMHHESPGELSRKRNQFAQSMGVPSTPWGKKGLTRHWWEHQADFEGVETPADYDAAARDFYSRASTQGVEAKIDGIENIDIDPGAGRISLYEASTNTFAAYDLRGNPKTMFKPETGIEYWNSDVTGDSPPPEFEFTPIL
jgi:RHS repeat-associated protein